MRARKKSAFTLIELLCVMAIIAILASLLLGPVMKAFNKVKRFEWESNSGALVERFQDRMTKYFGSAPKYPAFTPAQMYEAGIIDSGIRDFLKNKKVRFFPFSSDTPDQAPILTVQIDRKDSFTVYKRDIKPKD